MINILPTHVKHSLLYGRRNTRLLRWALTLVGVIIGIGVIVVLGQAYLNSSIDSHSEQLDKSREQLNAQKLGETQKEVEDISNSLKLVIQVLSREVLFSKLLTQIGSAIPANASLTDLKISKIEGAIDLVAVAADYNTATQVQVNLADPANKIFDKADIVSITCNTTSNVDARYPCTVNIRAQFAKNNPFLFINPSASKNP